VIVARRRRALGFEGALPEPALNRAIELANHAEDPTQTVLPGVRHALVRQFESGRIDATNSDTALSIWGSTRALVRSAQPRDACGSKNVRHSTSILLPMGQVLQLPDRRGARKAPVERGTKSPGGSTYYCTRCGAERFVLAASGMIHCGPCGAWMRNITVA